MRACYRHVQNGANPQCAGWPPPQAQSPSTGFRPDALRLPPGRTRAPGGATHPRGDAGQTPRPEARNPADAGRGSHPRGTRVGVIVVDASALLEFLLQTPLGARVEARLFRDEDELHAPHLVDVELVQGLRRLVRTGEVSSVRANEAIAALIALDLPRHAHVDLLGRAWRLRDNITAYDAVYVALAEAIEAPIVTCDNPLAKAPGHRARIEVID